MKKLSLAYLNFLTDDFGIWQHTKGEEIDKAEGYALDDSARALLVALAWKDQPKIEIYLRFIQGACEEARIINFFNAERQALPRPSSDDAIGECYWAVASVLNSGQDKELCLAILHQLKPHTDRFKPLRSQAYTVLGAITYEPELAHTYCNNLYQHLLNNKSADWQWPEHILTYANAIIPLALLKAGQAFQKDSYIEAGKEMLLFLNQITKVNGLPSLIGNKGWYPRGQRKAQFDQQPIDAAYQVLANLTAFEITQELHFLDEGFAYMRWFWGGNCRGISLINEDRECCYDGLLEDGVTLNAGAENIICYLLAQNALEPYLEQLLAVHNSAAPLTTPTN